MKINMTIENVSLIADGQYSFIFIDFCFMLHLKT